MLAMVEAVPMVMQCPAERERELSASMNALSSILLGAYILAHRPHRRTRADALALEPAIEHRPARDDDRRQIDARRPHHQRRRGLVAADQQHQPVQGIGAYRLRFNIDAGEVAIKHGQSGASTSRRGSSPGTRPESRPSPKRRVSMLGDGIRPGNAHYTASARTRCCRYRSPAGRRRHGSAGPDCASRRGD